MHQYTNIHTRKYTNTIPYVPSRLGIDSRVQPVFTETQPRRGLPAAGPSVSAGPTLCAKLVLSEHQKVIFIFVFIFCFTIPIL